MIKHDISSAVFVLLLVVSLVNNSPAQGCCGIGGSLVSGGYPVLNKGTFLAISSGNYADAKKPEDRRRESVGVLLAYGITDRLSLSLKTSYIWAKYSYFRGPIVIDTIPGDMIPGDTIPGETVVQRNNGFGDGFAGVQFAVIRLTPTNKQELITGMDVGIPWGPDSARVNGMLLPGNVQTGTGVFSVNGFVTYLKAFPAIHYALSSTIAGRVKLAKERKQGNGNESSAMLTSLFGPFFNTRGSVTFDYFLYGKDDYDPQTQITARKIGQRLSLIPALEYSVSMDLKLSINAEIPLMRTAIDKKFGNDKMLRAELYWFIPFAKDNSHQAKSISF